MNSGGGDHQSPPLPGGEFLLRLLQRLPQNHSPTPFPHRPIQSNGHTIPFPPIQSDGQDHPTHHPPFAPHAYIHRYPPNPDSSNSESCHNLGNLRSNVSPPNTVFGDAGEIISGFSAHEKTREGNRIVSRNADNFNSSSEKKPNFSRIREGHNGSESSYRNSANLSRIGEGYNRALNGNEANYRNYPNSSGVGEGYNGVLNGYEPNYRNSSNLSSVGEGYNRALNGYEANYRNSPNLSRIGEVYNRPLNGHEVDYRNSPNSSRFGEVYNRALNGHEVDYRNSPNLSRIGNNMALNGYQNFPNSSRIHEGNNGVFNRPDFDYQKKSSFGRNQGTSSGTVLARQEVRQPPLGSMKKKNNRKVEQNVDKEKDSSNGSRDRRTKHKDEREKAAIPGNRRNDVGVISERRLSTQLDSPGPPAGVAFPSVSDSEVEVSLSELHIEISENGEKQSNVGGKGLNVDDADDVEERMVGSLEEEDESNGKNRKKKRDKDYRSDTRGQRLLSQGMRKSSRRIECRGDIDMLNAPLLAIYDSLIPPEEEKMKQYQLLSLLESLVIKEWPEAQLFVYGSCANSFGVRNSDIDICLLMKDDDVNKTEFLLKLADILKAEKLENVQALTHARVPIVKLMDPSTGISCDICINNVLAVVNSKLLRDYAKIDDRLLQLAFIVKHWAKSRGVNETYYGTLSSYAYVLMCIHFLQQCRPAILPCLQAMDKTYSVVADSVECSFFDQVEKLSGFGLRNKESIGQLVWGFFRYWAYCHDYSHDVVSVRVGSIISKRAKDWTRRVGNDRHLICIEDPFELTHDLGRVVDKFSIKILKEEFERAAEILQFDPNPCEKLFEPFVRSS